MHRADNSQFKFKNLTRPFIIAEMSANHQQSLDCAMKIVEAAAQAGVDALKLQTYTPDTITIDLKENEFFIENKNSLWYGSSLYELYQKAYTPWEWHEPIFKRAKELGMFAFSTPFDHTAIDFLEKCQVPFYKIASFENIDLPLIKKVAQTQKPMIISTGLANLAEVYESVAFARENGCQDLVLLKCTSSYPANHSQSNLITLKTMKELFQCTVGISDHTPGIGAGVVSMGLGGMVIEKHFTLSRADGGPDAAFSLEPHEMKNLVTETHRAFDALGQVHFGPTDDEKASLRYRRSLYIVKDIQKGELFTAEHVRSIRPSLGISPKYYDKILDNKKAKVDIKRGTALRWELIE